MDVFFWRFSKKKESTLTPSLPFESTSLFHLQNVIFDDTNTSLMSPNLRVNYQHTQTSPYTPIFLCNYCYIPRFERFYYIGDWAYNADGTWTASCSVDVLGSFKANIRQSHGYLSRASDQTLRNPEILDTFYPSINLPFLHRHEIFTGFTAAPSGGTYMIGVVSGLSSTDQSDVPSFGAVTYYFIPFDQFKTLLIDFMNTGAADWSQVTDVSADVVKAVVDPFQYIVSCKLYPFSPPSGMTYTDRIKLGYWTSNALGHRTQEHIMSIPITLTFSETPGQGIQELYPETYTEDDVTYYLPNYAPYARYTLVHPLFGSFDIDTTIFSTYRSLYINTVINYLSGYATFTVSAIIAQTEDGQGHIHNVLHELIRTNAPIGIDVPLAQITTNYLSIGKSATSGVGNAVGIATGETMMNRIGAAVGLVGNMLDAATAAISPSVQTSVPPMGGYNNEIDRFVIQEVRFPTVEQAPDQFGYPVKKAVTSLPTSGFVLMDHTEFQGPCTSTEREMICEFLESGIYMEGFGNGG